MDPSPSEPSGPESSWTKPAIKTFRDVAELKLEFPHLYEELVKRGLIAGGEFVLPSDAPPPAC